MVPNVFARRFGPLLILLSLIATSSAFVYVGSDRLFAITAIEVTGDPIEVVVNEKKLPKNLLFFPSDRVREDILGDNPLLSSLELKKKFPHTLIVVAVRRVPVARIQLESVVGLVDRDGYIVGLDDGITPLPLIAFEGTRGAVGRRMTDEAVRAALILTGAIPPEYELQKITRFDRLSLRGEMEGTNIIVPQNIDAPSISVTLQTILSGFRIKGTMPTRIDLRFDKPVVEF